VESKNEFDSLEFQRQYSWQPTAEEKKFIMKFVVADLIL